MSFKPAFNLVEELKWRGLVHDTMPGTEELLMKEMVTGYAGFDPTADSLHIGNLVPMTLLYWLQKAGHKPVALVGGATGMVGDPSGKSAERKLLDNDTLQHNLNCQKNQLMQFLDFQNGENKAEMVNNFDWFKDISFLDFLREVGKHITVSYMMSKDSVKNRLENAGISFTEFSYQLIQGFDFCHLYEKYNCKLQVGGSDQWGNITTGTELIRRKLGGEAYALTAPLITKSDGTKFGKSEGGNIWLDASKTSPYRFYQFWLNIADDDAVRFIKIYSVKPKEEIEGAISAHTGNEHLRGLQKMLAEEMTMRIHSQKDCENAQILTEVFFGKGTKEQLQNLNAADLEAALEGMDTFEIEKEVLSNGTGIMDLLAVHTKISSSKGEAKKLIQSNGFSMNKEKCADENFVVNESALLAGKYILAQKGKKNYFVIKIK